jgi:hypothetical protein
LIAEKFFRKNRLPIREKIIWIAAISANNMIIVNKQVEWSGVVETSIANYGNKPLNLVDL